MENLPVIKATLAEWLQLTIEHPLYAAALVIGIWLLTTVLHSIKVAGLNKKNEQLRTASETSINNAEKQRQQAQDELTATTEQLQQAQQLAEAEKQRVSLTEQQLAQRNQQIATTIQGLASSFDIGERPLTAPADLKAEELWQQHDKIIKQLIERLRIEQQAKIELEKFYQAEKMKLAESEAKLASLQANLDSQASLVLTLQTQTTALQQQQNDTQRDLTETLKRHQADLARLMQLEQQASLVTHAQPTATIAPAQVQTTVVIEQTAPSPSVPTEDANAKLQNLFKKPQQPPVKPVAPVVEKIIISPQVIEPAIAETPAVLINNEQPEIEPAPPVIKSKPQPVIEPVVAESTEKVSALKGMYQKFTTNKAEKSEPVAPIKVETVEETSDKPSKGSALKGMYQKFTTKKAEQPESAPIIPVAVLEPTPIPVEPVVEQPPAPVLAPVEIIAKAPEKTSNTGQLKGLYQKYAKRQEKDLAPESFDDSSTSLEDAADQITEKLEKLKGVYGKFFSKKDE